MDFRNWIENQNLSELDWGKVFSTAALTAGLGGLGSALIADKSDWKTPYDKLQDTKQTANPQGIETEEPNHISNSPTMEELMNFIAKHEGRRNTSYTDSKGYRTIGIGLNLDLPNSRKRIESLGLNFNQIYSGEQGLTDQQINYLFQQDVEKHLKIAENQIQGLKDMPKGVQLVIIDMVFNLGSLSKFPKLRMAIQNKNWKLAAYEMENSRWFKQVGNRSKELVYIMKNN